MIHATFKNITAILLTAIILTAPAWSSVPAATESLNLLEVLQIAVQKNVRMILSQERVAQAVARIGQSRSVLWPQLNVNASQSRLTRDLRSSGITLPGDSLVGPINVFDARAQLMQTIFDPAAMARLKSVQAGHKTSVAELKKTREDVLALVATLYIEARRSAQSVEYAETLLAQEEKKLQIIENRLAAGISSQLEFKQAQTAYQSARRLWQQTSTQATETRLDLLAALGYDLKLNIQFDDEDGIVFPNEMLSGEDDISQLPEVRIAQEQVTLSQANRAAERSEYFPKLSALADYGPSGVTPSDANGTYALGVQVSLPIFTGGLRRARIEEADSVVKASEASLDDTRIQSQAEILKEQSSFHLAQFLVAEKDSQAEVAWNELRLIEQQLKDGTATDIQLLQAKTLEAQARNEQREARAMLLTAQINWAHALGKIENLLPTTDEQVKGSQSHEIQK